MNDADFHQKLFRHYLGELAFLAAVAVLVAYFIWPMFSSAVTAGFITLYAGNVGPKMPVLLAFADYPLAVAGVLLVYFAFFVLVLALLAQPAYHSVRLGLPRLSLPRIPVWRKHRMLAGLLFAGLPLVLSFGGTLAILQFVAEVAR